MSSTHDSLSGPDEGTSQSQSFIPAAGQSFVSLPLLFLSAPTLEISVVQVIPENAGSPALGISVAQT